MYESADIEGFGRSVWIINPDALSLRIHEYEGFPVETANGEALNRIGTWLDASIRAHQTVGVETVLSTDKYRRLVLTAKSFGFEFHLLYVVLQTVEQNIERVRLRVAKGGHPVPEEKIRSRRVRSLNQLPWFLHQADRATIFDNSGPEPQVICRKTPEIFEVDPDISPEIMSAITSSPT